MSFPVPIAYDLTDDNNTNVIYPDKVVSLMRVPLMIKSDIVLRYSEFTPENDILSTDQMRITIDPVNSIFCLFAKDEITPEPGINIAYASVNILYGSDGGLTRTQRTVAISETGEVISKAYVGQSGNTITFPTSPDTILKHGVTYIFLQLKIGE